MTCKVRSVDMVHTPKWLVEICRLGTLLLRLFLSYSEVASYGISIGWKESWRRGWRKVNTNIKVSGCRQDLNPQPTASAMSELEHRIVASAINKKTDPSVSNSVPLRSWIVKKPKEQQRFPLRGKSLWSFPYFQQIVLLEK